ncbi:hypothetical protein ARMGADRAFT_176576 [Armillaria gallica]|uniref:Uncharacterized protein n=1 Tax=Armillaria gallica TaxID=47427 RepID=A0A2H3CR19_ARMGA|nr:hypothetical protein ARMGADRAFT_176576 [Armillaria gallica]
MNAEKLGNAKEKTSGAEGRLTRKWQSESDASHVGGSQESKLPKLSYMSKTGESVVWPR